MNVLHAQRVLSRQTCCRCERVHAVGCQDSLISFEAAVVDNAIF